MSCVEKSSKSYFVESVNEPIISLNGDWKISFELSNEFWKNAIINSNWRDVKVPGEVMMQGFSIKNDIPFAYKKEIQIPKDFKDKNVYLQFDGVYSYARVWVNGKFVREHHGGFTRWKCNITPYVDAGEKAWITVEVTDRADDISYASGYAKHQIAGILRDVNLLALPKINLAAIEVETDLDRNYKNANLIVSGKLNMTGVNTNLKIQLFDLNNEEIPLKSENILLNDKETFKIENTILSPEKWDAEHPNLYKLKVGLYQDNKLLWSKNHSVGFREILVDGNSLLVNGKPVKLRGACRHDVHPTLGRVSTPEYELKDVLLTKEANMNYIRTSHYPPSENFLKLCDEYGIYVEDETAVCFVIDYRIKGYEAASNSQSDPEYTDRYLSQLEEMVENHRNHPSVIIWSIGNENNYGTNFKKSFDWVKENDKTRPIMFSYPGTAPDSITPYQILSSHYPSFEGDLNQFGKVTKGFGFEEMPVIHDEWAHVAAYNNATIKEDPNIRDFWGQSMDKMWSKTFDSDGGLGGAIWGMIDETFMLPQNLEGFRDWWGINDNTVLPYQGTTVGYGEWGIVDVWRRKKPEFWNTKKAYSPIKILNTTVENYKAGSDISIPIYNRFDHTNLNEIIVKYTYDNSTSDLKSMGLEPHGKGNLLLPIKSWDASQKIGIDFYDSKNNLIDSYKITQKLNKNSKKEITNVSSNKVTVTDNNQELVLHIGDRDLFFNKKTGLLSKTKNEGKTLAFKGPFMTYRTKGEKLTYSSNVINEYGRNWKLEEFNYELKENTAILNINGYYNHIKALFELRILASGEISTSYTFENLPKEIVREIGVKFEIENVFDELSWEREAYWSVYPSDHLSAPSGKVPLYSEIANEYRVAPKKSWTMDTKSFYYEGIASEEEGQFTQIAKGTKENIIKYSLLKNNKKWITVDAEGKVSCRLAKSDKYLSLYINNEMDYVDLSWGNYQKNIVLKSEYSGEINFTINSN